MLLVRNLDAIWKRLSCESLLFDFRSTLTLGEARTDLIARLERSRIFYQHAVRVEDQRIAALKDSHRRQRLQSRRLALDLRLRRLKSRSPCRTCASSHVVERRLVRPDQLAHIMRADAGCRHIHTLAIQPQNSRAVVAHAEAQLVQLLLPPAQQVAHA